MSLPEPTAWLRPATSVVCYLGILLYGGLLAVPGRRRQPGAAPQLLLLYIGLFPVPEPSMAWLAQQVLVAVALGSLGPWVLSFDLEQALDLSRARRGLEPGALPVPVRAALYVPAALAVGFALWSCATALLGSADDAQGVVRAFQRSWALVAGTTAAYLAAAWPLGRTWARASSRLRLMTTFARLNGLNVLGTVGFAIVAFVFLREPPGSIAVQWATLGLLAGCLLVGLYVLAWSYDAVLSRLLAFHALAAIVAAIVFGFPRAAAALGLGSVQSESLTVGLVSVAAMALPGSVTRWIELGLFPGAGRLRSRLASLATEPFDARTRADAAAQLLSRLVATLDARGGMVLLGSSRGEPPVLRCVGQVDPRALGSPAQAGRLVSRLLAGGRARHAERLAMRDRLLFMRCEVVLLCPLRAGDAGGALLLGPRRGWLYDTATTEAIEQLADRSGLAIENAGLLRAQAHAEKLAALGEAAARIAHEIRNPLAAARSLVQLAAQDPQVADLGRPALVELDRIGRLVGDLVTFARREDLLRVGALDLAEVCHEALAQVASLVEREGVEVAADLEPLSWSGDRDRLVQVVANLCRNALEALIEVSGPRRLHLRLRAAGGIAQLDVADNGPGIDPDQVEVIFEPFRTTKSTGTGLGLPIARRIVEAHGGSLEVESGAGGGTVFRLRLPRLPEAPPPSEPAARLA